MIKVTTIEPFVNVEHKETYERIEEFIMELSDLVQECEMKITVNYKKAKGEGLFYIEDSDGHPVSAGIIEEVKNRKRKTIKEYFNSVTKQ